MTLSVDPRLLAVYRDHGWRIAAGDYTLSLGASSRDFAQTTHASQPATDLPADYRGQ